MFALGILVGIYSYALFGLGLLGLLSRQSVLLVTLLTIVGAFIYFRKKPEDLPRVNLRKKEIKSFLFLFILLAGINFLGVLAPEVSFDALWYHLTIPKIFLENGSIHFIPGGLFYYSPMPKLGDMIFMPSLALNTAILAKFVSFLFGILTSLVIYRISRMFVDEKYSILASLIFYGSLVVAWESTIAYIDLTRAFFEAMALWGFVIWAKTRERKWLLEAGVMLGLAIATKLLAIGSIFIFIALMIYWIVSNKEKVEKILPDFLRFLIIAVFVPLPWFAFSFINTSNPFYPIFSNYNIGFDLSVFNPINFIKDIGTVFLKADDPISPIFAIVLPLIILVYKKLDREQKLIALYSVLAIFIWYFTPRTGGGRFILPYLPAFSVLSIVIISKLEDIRIKKILLGIIVLVFLSTVVYRGMANLKTLPSVLGSDARNEYLTNRLNYEFGDFYDTDGFFKENIKESDTVLLYGFHNLYYADFPFIHESYVEKGDRFNYIATQNAPLPKRFSHWELIYRNDKTNVSVYSSGGMKWSY